MNLFIDGISSTSVLILFDEKRNIVSREDFIMKGNESSNLISNIDDFLKKQNLKYNNLENIVVVNGPGSFTGIRTIVLCVNTINYIIGKNITPLSYFDLFNNYPIIKSSSKKDSFLKESFFDEIKIIENSLLLEKLNNIKINKVYGYIDSEFFPKLKIFDKIDYSTIIQKIELKNYKKIQALYIKKPNIS